ncbi:MAG: sulfatase [Pseudomonadota bacterium]
MRRAGHVTPAYAHVLWDGGRLVLAGAVLHLVLIQPNHPTAMTLGALRVFPLELPALLLLLIALPVSWRGAHVLRLILAFVLTVIATLKLADFASFTALSRGFNPVSDLTLIGASFRLASGTFGLPAAIALSILAGALIVGLALTLWWAMGIWLRVSLRPGLALGAGIGAVTASAVAAYEIGGVMGRWELAVNPPGAAFTARVGVERVVGVRRTFDDLRAFREAATDDPFADRPDLFTALDRDLLILYVESYGRGILETSAHADTARAALEAAAPMLGEAGLTIRSGWLDAPTRGGQSWLSHMSLATGLRIDGQTKFAASLASPRRTLFELANDAGLATAAIMPAITMPWPEAKRMGFDRVYAAADLGYAGAPFNWVTMPDQYTLHATERLLLDAAAGPVVAQIALISSHAPWVPVPALVDWGEIGDGGVFTPMALAGDPPDIVWRDRDRVRLQYAKAVTYALDTTFDWIARRAKAEGRPVPLVLLVGDHQPAGFVTGDTRPDVPAHLIGPAAFTDRAAQWGWETGLFPDPDGPVDGMEAMRDRLLDLVSAPPVIERAAR